MEPNTQPTPGPAPTPPAPTPPSPAPVPSNPNETPPALAPAEANPDSDRNYKRLRLVVLILFVILPLLMSIWAIIVMQTPDGGVAGFYLMGSIPAIIAAIIALIVMDVVHRRVRSIQASSTMVGTTSTNQAPPGSSSDQLKQRLTRGAIGLAIMDLIFPFLILVGYSSIADNWLPDLLRGLLNLIVLLGYPTIAILSFAGATTAGTHFYRTDKGEALKLVAYFLVPLFVLPWLVVVFQLLG